MKLLLLGAILIISVLQAEEYFYQNVKFVKINMLVPKLMEPIIGDQFHMKIKETKEIIKKPDITFHCNNCGQCFINNHNVKGIKQFRFELNSGILNAINKKAEIVCRVENGARYKDCKVIRLL